MSNRKPAAGGPGTREERLAAALRANLRRRKAAARAGVDDHDEDGNPPKPADSHKDSRPSGRRS